MIGNRVTMRQLTILGLLIILFGGLWAPGLAVASEEAFFFEEEIEFLDVDDAFSIGTDVLDEQFIIRWTIADGYYLYKHRFGFTATGVDLAEPIIPEGLHKTDEYFGEVEVYYNHIEITVPYTNSDSVVSLSLSFQGCADAGLCYTPTTRHVSYEKQQDGTLRPVTGIEKTVTTDIASPALSPVQKEKDNEVYSDQTSSLSTVLAEENLIWTLITFLGAGLLLTFTPCVLPMVPILSGIIAGQGRDITPAKAFRLSFIYVQAMAITYAILGILVAKAGSSLSGYLQSPVIISIVALIFVLLALSMFGLYELTIPAFLTKQVQGVSEKQRGGNYLGVAFMGVISTLIVSPWYYGGWLSLLRKVAR